MAETPATIDRRALIRRGVVAGAVAWTAPVIVGSIASPAAAATGAKGCNRIQMSGAGCGSVVADGNCLPTGWGACANTLNSACITSTTGPTCTGMGVNEVFVITGGCSCTFVAAASRLQRAHLRRPVQRFRRRRQPDHHPDDGDLSCALRQYLHAVQVRADLRLIMLRGQVRWAGSSCSSTAPGRSSQTPCAGTRSNNAARPRPMTDGVPLGGDQPVGGGNPEGGRERADLLW